MASHDASILAFLVTIGAKYYNSVDIVKNIVNIFDNIELQPSPMLRHEYIMPE